MADKPWKQFEREVAEIVRGQRFWANSGEQTDVRSTWFEVQCKNVQVLSLAAMGRLLDTMEEIREKTNDKLARENVAEDMLRYNLPGYWDVIAVKQRAGRGKKTRTIFIMDGEAVRGIVARLSIYRGV